MENPLGQINNCLSCGETITGKFCSSCGEKVLHDNEKTISHFIGEAFHAITHADGKFFKSLACIFFKPGKLTVNYLEGRRKQFMSPLSIFVFANLLYLLLSPVDALNSSYHSQRAQLYGNTAKHKFEEKMKVKNWNEEQMALRYNAKSGKLAKLLLILMVLYFSIPLAVVYFSPKRFYVEHLVFSTEVINFLILIVFLILPWILNIAFLLISHFTGISTYFDPNTDTSIVILGLVLISYFTIASRRVYRSPWWLSILKSVILFIGLFYCIVLYRFTLFHTTLALL